MLLDKDLEDLLTVIDIIFLAKQPVYLFSRLTIVALIFFLAFITCEYILSAEC